MIGVAFTERMDGRLVCGGERFDRRVWFEMTAVGPSARAMLGVAELDVAGAVHVDGIAAASPAGGSLLVSPFTQRRIVYSLTFRGDDASPLHLAGVKSLDYTHPVESWTSMYATLDRDGRPLAQGHMWFRARDLGTFLASFHPIRTTRVTRGGEAVA